MADLTRSTQAIPESGSVPRHVAIIMDGNGRWAKKRFLPRVGGHRKGVEAVREVVGKAGHEGAIIIGTLKGNKDSNDGFNAATGKFYDLVASGVIDPTKVTRSALQNATSISALMLTTEAMICEIPEKKSAPAGGGGRGFDPGW